MKELKSKIMTRKGIYKWPPQKDLYCPTTGNTWGDTITMSDLLEQWEEISCIPTCKRTLVSPETYEVLKNRDLLTPNIQKHSWMPPGKIWFMEPNEAMQEQLKELRINMTRKEIYNALAARIKERYPDSRIRYKSEHWFWKRMPAILRKSGITPGKTIWMPERNDHWEMLAHEYVHLVDLYERPIMFRILYFAPQILAIPFLIGTILTGVLGVHPAMIALLVFTLLFLSPLPSPSRTNLEMRGYSMGLYIRLLQGGDILEGKRLVVDAIRRWLYYKMVWLESTANNIVSRHLAALDKATEINIAFKDVTEILNG